MPFKRKADYREYHTGYMRELYQSSEEFRQAEAKRKADWYALRASDPAWLAAQALKKRVARVLAKADVDARKKTGEHRRK